MARWRVDYLRMKDKHFPTVEAPDEKTAIAMAMKTFHITAAAAAQDAGRPTCAGRVMPGRVLSRPLVNTSPELAKVLRAAELSRLPIRVRMASESEVSIKRANLGQMLWHGVTKLVDAGKARSTGARWLEPNCKDNMESMRPVQRWSKCENAPHAC